MPDRPQLAATSRTVTGKAVAHLRRDGLIPAVVYGRGTDSESLSVDAHEFELLRRHTGASTLIDLTVDGGGSRPVLVHNVQIHPVNRHPLHVDLFAVRMTEELTVEVPLVGTGTALAADNGGTLVHPVSSVKVRALPGNLPDTLTYDLSPLVSFDETITVADIVAPEGVTIQADSTEVIARVLPPRVEEAPVVAEAELLEGELPEGEAGEEAAETESSEASGEG
jgi:large subunit ribosomal protein L25